MDIDKDANIDGKNGEQDTGQGHCCKLVDKFDTKKDDGAHHNDKKGAIYPKIIEFDGS